MILFLPGMVGVLSFLLVDLSTLIALIPSPPGTQIPTIPALKLLSLIQPTLILALAVFAGVALANRVGLSAPAAEALATGGDSLTALKPQLVPGLIGGVVGGSCIVITSALFKPLLEPEVIERISEFMRLFPVPIRLLYGGITEELLLRWGFMTLLVWLAWRFLQQRRDAPSRTVFVAAIVISSLLFGVAHLPVAFMLFPEPGIALIGFIIIANSAFGLIAGYLYWRNGLESAIIAHMTAHLVMIAASYAGIYFR